MTYTMTFAPGWHQVIDPACGDGQFLMAGKWLKVIEFNMSQDEALEDIYGVDIMRDNIDQIAIFNIGGKTIDELSTRVFAYNLENEIKEEWLTDVVMYWEDYVV